MLMRTPERSFRPEPPRSRGSLGRNIRTFWEHGFWVSVALAGPLAVAVAGLLLYANIAHGITSVW